MKHISKDIRKKHDLRTRQGRADAEREQKDRDEGCLSIFITFFFYCCIVRIAFLTVQLLGFEDFGKSDLHVFIGMAVAGFLAVKSIFTSG